MPNNVRNRLEIHCEDAVTMDKIKMMIFDEDQDRNRIFTMGKMLPLPARFSGTKGYTEYGYHWCRAMWGTKWDVYDCTISESGNTIIIYYHTAWSPNDNWVELLCLYISRVIGFREKEDTPNITVELKYYDYPGGFGGILEWVPNINPKSKSYPVMEYARLHDTVLYDNLVRIEKPFDTNDENDSPMLIDAC
jgi:hypothetical protein